MRDFVRFRAVEQPKLELTPGEPALAELIGSDGGIWAAAAAVASRQHSVISLTQLFHCGLSPGAVKYATHTARLHRLHRGIYAVGHPRVSHRGRWLAAVLAAGPGALISHLTAARLYRLHPPDSSAAVDLTLPHPAKRGHTRPGIHTHAADVPAGDAGLAAGIPAVSPAWMLLGVAASASAATLERIHDEACVHNLLRPGDLDTLIARSAGCHGNPALRDLARRQAGPAGFTREAAERKLWRLLTAAPGIPRPARNATVRDYEVDALWPDARLIAEVDGYATHGHRAAFERDRRKRSALEASGYRVLAFTWRQLCDEPRWVTATIRSALTA